MKTAPPWAEGTNYQGQDEFDDYDFCTVGEITYLCHYSHVASPDTHPTRGMDGRETWGRAAWSGLDALSDAAMKLNTVLKVVQAGRYRLAPAGMSTEERQHYNSLADVLEGRAKALSAELTGMTGEHPADPSA